MTELSNSPSSSTVLVYGAGSIGCYVGGCLLAAGVPVTLLGRASMRKVIAHKGLHLTDWQGRDEKVSPAELDFVEELNKAPPPDYLLVTVKSADTETVATELLGKISPHTVIVSLQNGVGNATRLSKLLPDNQVLAGMVPFNVINQGNGHFHCGTEGRLALQNSSAIINLLSALQAAGLTTQLHQEMPSVLWGKLLINLNNAVNALAGRPLKAQLSEPAYREVLALCIEEGLLVLRKAGIKPARIGKAIPSLLPTILRLPNFLFTRVAAAMLKIDPQARSSMADDLAAGRNTEIDWINGEIVELGRQLGVSTLVNEKIIQLIHDAEQVQNFSGIEPAELLLKVSTS